MLKATKKLYYVDLPNMGDQINKLIFSELFGISVKEAKTRNADVIAIGSVLNSLLIRSDESILKRMTKKVYGCIYQELHIWGTGFIKDIDNYSDKFYRKMVFHAVRGKLSLERVRRISGQSLENIVMGDAGILACHLVEAPTKKYKIGIVPHFREKTNMLFSEMANVYPNSILIDITAEPLDVIRQISSCECILSSSLHGLIVADSFHIPNMFIYVTSSMRGDGIKYRDYYSNFDLPGEPLIIKTSEDFPTVESIKADYAITAEQIEEMKQNMIQSFPYGDMKVGNITDG